MRYALTYVFPYGLAALVAWLLWDRMWWVWAIAIGLAVGFPIFIAATALASRDQ